MFRKIIIVVGFVITQSGMFFAQNFVVLGTDAANDALCACSDLKQLSVAYNIAQDSVWFKIETHNARGAAYGYYIELDWDENATTGTTVTGGGLGGSCAGPQNYANKKDRTINIWPSTIYFEQWTSGGSGSTVPGATANVKYPDAYTVIVNTKLSHCDMDADGNFNVFASVGAQSYGYDMLDIMPNSGVYNTASVGVFRPLAQKSGTVKLAGKQLLLGNVLQNSMASVSVYDITGKLIVQVKNPDTNSIDVSTLYENAGVYIYKIEKTDGEILTGKISVVN